MGVGDEGGVGVRGARADKGECAPGARGELGAELGGTQGALSCHAGSRSTWQGASLGQTTCGAACET